MVFFKQHDVELFDLLGSLSSAVFQSVVKRLQHDEFGLSLYRSSLDQFRSQLDIKTTNL